MGKAEEESLQGFVLVDHGLIQARSVNKNPEEISGVVLLNETEEFLKAMAFHLELVSPGIENSATSVHVFIIHGSGGKHIQGTVVLGLLSLSLQL